MKYGERIELAEDGGWIKGPDGCDYETAWDALYSTLELCGCGSPEENYIFLASCLEATSDKYPNIIDYKKVRAIVLENPETVTELVLHLLDAAELTEHGGSVYGSWLTDRGRQFIEHCPEEDDAP